MEVLYRSTRGNEESVSASKAILEGLASDSGLFVPQALPSFDKTLDEFAQMDYRQTAYEVMKLLLTDFTEEELRYCIDKAYDGKFDTEAIAPLAEVKNAWYLELFHGPTIAFKDMALSILPYLMTTAAKKNQIKNEIVILTATSGDTGKAALAGFADVPGTRIMVFYPKDGVSPIKELAAWMEERGYQFSSANSINIGRLVPQIVYYVYAYAQLVKEGRIKAGEEINVTVPTGNFGNILAAYYAKNMGLPIKKLICASNDNKVLYDFFRTGAYDRNRDFILTTSPSMDILISSNLERLIYRIAGEDATCNASLMAALAGDGKYEITAEMKEKLGDFYGNYATQEECAAQIRSLYEDTGYVLDPHTAVAAAVYNKYKEETGDTTKTVIASTASPYKFTRTVLSAMDEKYADMDDFALTEELEKISGVKIPDAITKIRNAPVLHNIQCEKDGMKQAVMEFLEKQ